MRSWHDFKIALIRFIPVFLLGVTASLIAMIISNLSDRLYNQVFRDLLPLVMVILIITIVIAVTFLLRKILLAIIVKITKNRIIVQLVVVVVLLFGIFFIIRFTFSKSKSVDVIANFKFAGWMGDGEKYGENAITLDDAYTKEPHSSPTCVKVTYRPMSVGWAGIYAQYNVEGTRDTRENNVEGTEENWGDRLGMNLAGYTKLIWYAKGETGNEMVEFKAGGIYVPDRPYRDSFQLSLGIVRLGKEWKRYEMDLSNEDLSLVIGGFCWVAKWKPNRNGLTFYVDSITYEKPRLVWGFR